MTVVDASVTENSHHKMYALHCTALHCTAFNARAADSYSYLQRTRLMTRSTAGMSSPLLATSVHTYEVEEEKEAQEEDVRERRRKSTRMSG